MKIPAILIVFIFAACVKSDENMMMKVVEGCKNTVGASDEDLQKFMAHKVPDNQEQKCMIACIMTGLGLVRNEKSDALKIFNFSF